MPIEPKQHASAFVSILETIHLNKKKILSNFTACVNLPHELEPLNYSHMTMSSKFGQNAGYFQLNYHRTNFEKKKFQAKIQYNSGNVARTLGILIDDK